MRHFDESLARLAANALRGRVRCHQIRMLRFQILQLPHQLVELAVVDLRIVYNVIEVFVMTDLLPQGFDLFLSVFHSSRHRKDYRRKRNPRTLLCEPLRYNPASTSHAESGFTL